MSREGGKIFLKELQDKETQRKFEKKKKAIEKKILAKVKQALKDKMGVKGISRSSTIKSKGIKKNSHKKWSWRF